MSLLLEIIRWVAIPVIAVCIIGALRQIAYLLEMR